MKVLGESLPRDAKIIFQEDANMRNRSNWIQHSWVSFITVSLSFTIHSPWSFDYQPAGILGEETYWPDGWILAGCILSVASPASRTLSHLWKFLSPGPSFSPLQIFVRVIGSLVQSRYMGVAATLTINKCQVIKEWEGPPFEDLILVHPQFPSGWSKKTPQGTVLAKTQLKLCFHLKAYLDNTKTSYIWHLSMEKLPLNQNAFSLPSVILFSVTITNTQDNLFVNRRDLFWLCLEDYHPWSIYSIAWGLK